MMDQPFQFFLQALREIGFNCIFGLLPDQKYTQQLAALFDRIETNLDKAVEDSDLIYLALDSQEYLGFLPRLNFKTVQHKLVVDVARCSLKIRNDNERMVREFLTGHGLHVIARDERQLMDKDDRPIPCEALVSQDYLRFSYLPRPLFADMVWFMKKVLGTATTPQPPSAYIEELISAEPDNQETRVLAEKTLQIDRFFPYALIRLRLPEIIDTGGIPRDLEGPMKRSLFSSWHAQLQVHRHLPGDSSLKSDMSRLQQHVFPRPPAARGSGKRILILVAYKQRDLFIDLMIKYWLEQMGHEVFVRAHENIPENSILEILPDAVVWGPKITMYQMALGQFATERNILSIIRRQEGGQSKESWNGLSPSQKNWWLGIRDYTAVVDFEIVYSQEYADILGSEGHIPRDKCAAVGNMIMDPYFIPRIDRALPSKEEFCSRLGLDPRKKIMLLASRWAHADGTPQRVLPEALSKPGQTSDSIPEVMEVYEEHKEARNNWLGAIKRLYAEKGADWNFILKPHPCEKNDPYINYFEAHDIHVPVTGGYMLEILNYVDLLIHSGSSSAMEAHYLGIPTLAFWLPEKYDFPIARLVPRANTYEELDRLIMETALGRSNADPEVIALLERGDYHGRMDGKACLRAAHLIDMLVRQHKTRPFRYPQDRYKPGASHGFDPYDSIVTQEEVDYYYNWIKKSLDSADSSTVGPGSFE
jgi:surface carbohydrate biosynthesis protein